MPRTVFSALLGRGERIRTSGLYVPNVALYQAKLHPVSDCGKASRALGNQYLRRAAKVDNCSKLFAAGDVGRTARQAAAAAASASARSRAYARAPVRCNAA